MRPVAVVGPSGGGKDTLMAMACAADPRMRAARRVITRPAEAGSEDFDPVDEAGFERLRRAGEFVLHWRAHGLNYGIPRAQLAGAGVLLMNLSRAVLAEAQAHLPGLSVILVTAPPEVLADRLARRGREEAGDLARRLARAGFALPEGIHARTVTNDGSPEQGLVRFLAALQPERA